MVNCNSQSKGNDIRAFVAAMVIFLMIPPVFAWNLFSDSFFFRFVLSLIYLLIILSEYGSIKQKNGIPFLLFLLLIVFYLRGEFHLASAVTTVIFASTLLLKPTFIKKIAHFFFLILATLLVPSVIQYVLVSFFDISFPHIAVAPLNELKDFGYQAYTFFVQNDAPFLLFPRFHSYFDEAGIVGSFCVVALYYNHFNLKKWHNITFLIAGLLSFSFFFYIASIIYLLFFLELGASEKRKRVVLLGKGAVIMIILAISIFLYQLDNEVLNEYIFNRLQLDEDKGFVGNNRDVSTFRDWYERFRFSSDYWFGLGGGKSLELNQGGASYKNIIVDYGFVGLIMYVFLFSVLSWKSYKKKKYFYMFCAIFIMMIYQRPFITHITYYQLFLYMAECVSEVIINKDINERHRSRRRFRHQTLPPYKGGVQTIAPIDDNQ